MEEIYEDLSKVSINDSLDISSQNQILIISIPEHSVALEGHTLYSVVTKTNMPQFKKKDMKVERRFSDFLGLYDKILKRNAHLGVIIPIPPEKNYINNKSVSNLGISNQTEFLEHRRIELERFLDRLSKHSYLRNDPALLEFLEFEGTLPKAVNTQIFSGSSAIRLMKSFGDSFKSINFQMDEEDSYFANKVEELDAWEKQLAKLSSVASCLCENHQSLANEIVGLYQSLNNLSEADDDEDSIRLFKQLGQLNEQMAEFSHIKAQAETIYILDAFKDFSKMISSSKNALNQREKIYRSWKEEENNLNSKRIEKAKAELSMKDSAYVKVLAEKLVECEHMVDQNKESFEVISKNLKKEFEKFDSYRFNELKNSFVSYLNIMVKVHKDSQQLWSSYLTQATA